MDWLRRPMRALIVLLLVVVAACTSGPPSAPLAGEDTARRDALATAVREAEAGASIDLGPVLGEDWDRAVFIGRRLPAVSSTRWERLRPSGR